MSKRVFKTELDAVNNSLQSQVNNSISKTIVDAKGDIVTASAADTPIRLAVGTNEHRLVADSATTSGLKYVADTTNYAVGAKGDLLVGTAADTVSALTVGTNGDTLVADSSTSTGLRWQATQSTQNYIINGGADFWQRGTSAAATLNYLCDRFQFNRSGGVGSSTVSRSTDAPTGFQYSIKNQRDSGNTQTNSLDGYYAIETSQSIPLAGKTVVLSFYAKKGANYSGGDLSVTLSSGTGTDQPYYSFTSLTTVSNTLVPNATLNTSWTRYYVTGTVSSSATQVGFKTSWTPTGTAGADDSVYMTGFQLEVGSVPTTFRRAGGTLAGEYAAACRYYYRQTENPSWIGNGFCNGTTLADIQVFLPVLMRTSPSITFANGTNFFGINFGSSSVNTNTVSNIYDAAPRSFYARFTTTGLTNGFGAAIKIQNASAYWEASAEL